MACCENYLGSNLLTNHYRYKWPTEAYQYNVDNLDSLFIELDWLKKSCFINPVTKTIYIRLRSMESIGSNLDLILNPGDWLVRMGILKELTVFEDYKFKYLFEEQPND